MKVGSMFAGIGGFDLGFERAGFEVAWCIEWDKHAQAVLRKRFPNAKVYGDIREVDPDVLERVDVICGGFPCQDLSVAGKRAGLAGERSGLFYDAMRLVRRLNPSLLVLENVPGLLSSNRGLDFAAVLREVGEGWNCSEVAWRVLDSQFFRVAQRRRRVFIVGSSRIGCAEEILALAEGSGGDYPTRGEARQAVAADAARCADVGSEFIYGGGSQDTSDTVTSKWHKGSGGPAGNETGLFVAQPFSPHGHYRYEASDQSATLQDRENRQGGHTHLVAQAFGISEELTAAEDVMPTIQRGGDGGRHEFVAQAFRKSRRAQSSEDDESWVDDGIANTLNGFDTGDTRTTHAIAYGISNQPTPKVGVDLIPGLDAKAAGDGRLECVAFKTGNSAKARSDGMSEEQSPTLGSNGGGNTVPAVAFSCKDHGSDASAVAPTLRAMPHVGSHANGGGQVAVATSMVVRRLTPVECERLQGFPDGWTDIGTPEKPTADTHRYKQLGNAVTVNVAEWIARRAHKCLSSR